MNAEPKVHHLPQSSHQHWGPQARVAMWGVLITLAVVLIGAAATWVDTRITAGQQQLRLEIAALERALDKTKFTERQFNNRMVKRDEIVAALEQQVDQVRTVELPQIRQTQSALLAAFRASGSSYLPPGVRSAVD